MNKSDLQIDNKKVFKIYLIFRLQQQVSNKRDNLADYNLNNKTSAILIFGNIIQREEIPQ